MHALDHQIGVVHHHTGVGGDVRLALGGIHQNGVDLVLADGVQLAPQGECGTAQTNHTAVLDGGQEAVHVVKHGGLQVGILFHLAVALDLDGESGAAIGLLHGLDGGNGTGNGSVDGAGHALAGFGDQLTHTHIITHGHDGLGGRSGVHVHGEQNFLGGSDTDRLAAGRVLVVVHFQGRNVFSELHQVPSSSIL